MLGKLLKHEFRATGRVMLPVYGAVLVLAALANVSIRMLRVVDNALLTILFGLIVAAFVIGVIAAAIMTAVMMIKRFYQNLLKDEGYLMHTLPVTVHEQVWAKLIVSCVWFLLTFLVIWLVVLLTVLIQNGTSLGELFDSLPSWAEIRQALAEMGVPAERLGWFIAELLAYILVSGLLTCLHFYAAMSLGHIFAKDKILLSIVFFVVISFVFSLFSLGYNMLRMTSLVGIIEGLNTIADGARFGQQVLLHGLLMETVQAAILYVATTLSLKKGLNLA